MIRRLIVILTFAVLLVSCGPSRYTVHVEMRHPSKTGLDLAGKIVSVVYYSGKDSLENEAAENMAMGFAEVIEKDNGTGDGSVGVYSVERSAGNYTLKDSLVNLVIQTDGDVRRLRVRCLSLPTQCSPRVRQWLLSISNLLSAVASPSIRILSPSSVALRAFVR